MQSFYKHSTIETIEIAVELIFQNKPNLKISKNELQQLFKFATFGTHFLFKGDFYDQIDGVSMVSPLGPVLANLFMGYHERNWLQEFDIGEVLLYRCYVDDIFSMFRNEIDAENFFKYLHSKHSNIKFTMEKETNKFLPILDVLVKNEGRIFTTSVYRKKTAIGLFTQYNSCTPFSYKIGLIKCLVHTAFKISSSYIIFHNEINKIRNILQKNMYPIFVIDNQIKRFLEMQYTTISNENTVNNNKKVYFKIPYIRTFSNATKIKLNQICDKCCKNTNIVVAFSPLKIGSFFSCKDSIPKFLQSYVVYQFTCAGYNACYIGETKRHLKTRIEEHLGKDKNSQILKHLQENPHCREVSNFDCFDVIDRDNSHFRLLLKESMHITWKKPILNKQIKHVTLTISV